MVAYIDSSALLRYVFLGDPGLRHALGFGTPLFDAVGS